MPNLKDNLIKWFIESEAFKIDEEKGFALSSGSTSPFYVDCKALLANPKARQLVAKLAFHEVRKLPIDCIGGLEIGSIAIATTISDYAYRYAPEKYKRNWPTFIVRKHPKEHGLSRTIEGIIEQGDRALIVDDVLTSGGSVIKAVETARQNNLQVSHALVIVDREEPGGRAFVESHGITLLSLLTISDLKDLRNPGSAVKLRAI